jgi:hypothetical protein
MVLDRVPLLLCCKKLSCETEGCNVPIYGSFVFRAYSSCHFGCSWRKAGDNCKALFSSHHNYKSEMLMLFRFRLRRLSYSRSLTSL